MNGRHRRRGRQSTKGTPDQRTTYLEERIFHQKMRNPPSITGWKKELSKLIILEGQRYIKNHIKPINFSTYIKV